MQALVKMWVFFFAVVMVACCWRVVGQWVRGRRCTEVVRGTCTGTQSRTWVHGDAADETKLARPVYAYEYGGVHYESAAGVATMLFEYSPTAKTIGEPIELRVNPSNPFEVHDAAYEAWFARYRVIWGVVSCIGLFALVTLLDATS